MNDCQKHGGEGQTGVVSALFEAHAGYVQRLLRRFGVPERDIADVSQDVFVTVCRKLGSFEGRSSIRTWFYRICLRAAIDQRRRAHRRYECLTDPPEPCADAPQVDELSKRNTATALRAALDELSADKRAVFVLYELEEMTMAEIALLLRCPLQTAFARLYAARRHVNRALARAGWVGAALAVGAPARTAWAASPELHATVSAWRAKLPGAFLLAQLGAQSAIVSHGVSIAAAVMVASIAAVAQFGTPHVAAPRSATVITQLAALPVVVLHRAPARSPKLE